MNNRSRRSVLVKGIWTKRVREWIRKFGQRLFKLCEGFNIDEKITRARDNLRSESHGNREQGQSQPQTYDDKIRLVSLQSMARSTVTQVR